VPPHRAIWREVAAAAVFGVRLALDAHIGANLLPLFAAALLAGAVAPALAPTLAHWRRPPDPRAGRICLARVHRRLAAISSALGVALWFAGLSVLEALDGGSGSGSGARGQVLALYGLPLFALTPALGPLCSACLMFVDLLARHGVVPLAWGNAR